MAPEQAAGDEDVDHRADLYALGCLAYEMIAGRPPFVETSASKLFAAHLTQAPTPIRDLGPDTPKALADLVMQLLEKGAAARPQSADQVLRVLDGINVSSGDHPRMPSVPGS